MMIKTVIFQLIILIYLPRLIYSWDLTVLGLNNTSYKLRHISRSYVRTFLSIESTIKSIIIPTLIEVTWPENILKVCPIIYPNYNEHAVSVSQQDCNKIQQSGWSEIDDIGRLWLLDIGNKYCSAKLIIYEINNNPEEYKLIHRTLCPFRQNTVNSMKLIDIGISVIGRNNVFFTFDHGKYIWMYMYLSHTWRKFKFHDENMSRTYVNQLTFTPQSNLYLTDKFGKLFTTNLPFCLNKTEIQINNIGSLLGPTSYLIADPNGILYYILIKDGAVVRCDPSKLNGLIAENHEILMLQSIPILQIFFGVQGSIWSAMETIINNNNDHCQRMLYHYSLKSDFSQFLNDYDDNCENN